MKRAPATKNMIVPALGKPPRRRTLAGGGAWYDPGLVKAGGSCPDALLGEVEALPFNDRHAQYMSFHNNALPRDKMFLILPGAAPPGVYPRYKYPGWQWDAVPRYIRMEDLPGGGSPELKKLVEHVQAAHGPFTFVIVTRYVDGTDKIAWHSDKTDDFAKEGVILNISLGEPRAFELRPAGSKGRAGIETVMMEHGSGLVLTLEGNATHQHRLRAQSARERAAKGPVGVRYSLIFRNIATVVDEEEIRNKKIRKPAKKRRRAGV